MGAEGWYMIARNSSSSSFGPFSSSQRVVCNREVVVSTTDYPSFRPIAIQAWWPENALDPSSYPADGWTAYSTYETPCQFSDQSVGRIALSSNALSARYRYLACYGRITSIQLGPKG